MLDKIHDPLPKTSADTNAYTLGKLCGHHVVIACLPSGIYGTISAADVLSHLVRTFQTIKFGLMVGIGGGVPNNSNDIRLGDVVASKPTGNYNGVIQYGYARQFKAGSLNRLAC
jgi:nucleoside phosphorylase